MAGQTETLVSAILADIDTGRLAPGQEIDEAALGSRHGVSRTPIREAYIQLETMGLIRRLPRKGAVLFKPTLEEFLAIQEVHSRLGGQAAALAARRMGSEQAEELENIAREAESLAASGAGCDAFYRLKLGFHDLVARGSSNPMLQTLLKTNSRLLMAYSRARFRYPGAMVRSAQEMRQIARYIKARDSGKTEDAMVAHMQFDQVTVMDLLAAVG